MNVRPIFWILLAFVCAGVLLFAAGISATKVVPMRARIDQISNTSGQATSLRLALTDPEGEPIDQASIIPSVSMVAMRMGPQQIKIQPLGQGLYLTQIHFSMAGSWQITITARADGFDVVHRSIQLFVS